MMALIPNFERTPYLSNYINHQLIEDQPIDESKVHLLARRTFQGYAILAGTLARVPFISIITKWAGDRKILGYTLAGGSAISFGAFISWCMLNIVDAKMRPLSVDESELLKSRIPKKYMVAITIVVIATGVIAQIPLAVMAFEYNNHNFIYPLGALLVDSGYPIYSLQLTAESLLKMRFRSSQEKKMLSLKGKFIKKLETNRLCLGRSQSEWRTWIAEWKCIEAMEPDNRRVQSFLQFALSLKGENKTPKKGCLSKTGNVGAMGVGVVLAVSQLIFAAMLTYVGTQTFTSNKIALYSVSSLVVLCSLYLNLSVMAQSTSKIYYLGLGLLNGQPPSSIEMRMYSKTYLTLMFFSLATSALAFVGPLQVSNDYFQGAFKEYMAITCIIGTVLLSMHAMTALSESIVRSGGNCCGSRDNKDLIKLDEGLQRLIHLLNECPTIDFVNLLKNVPREKLVKWMYKADIAHDDIQQFLDEVEDAAGEKKPLIQ